MKKNPFVSKEISWLNFNERVLQEASSEEVPELERLKFLGIFSSNMDEFFLLYRASRAGVKIRIIARIMFRPWTE